MTFQPILHTLLAATIGALLAVMLMALRQRRQSAQWPPAPHAAAHRRPVNPDVQRALNMRHMRTIQTQGIITALMDIDREVTPNPHEHGTPERAVWYGGYAMAAAKAREVVL